MLNKSAIKRPFLIAGPCSAESKAQVLSTAEQMQGLDLAYFRAGIWKPRTRPGDFEGVGSIGLPWLQEVREKYGFKVCAEVANVKHVEECLAAEIDMLWIGARTTTNPFSVQEIADALQGVNIPVVVKNPINPDLKLWMGAIERIEKAGIKEIGAVHRGFSTYEKKDYRNEPMWQIPIDFQNEMPEIPLICDPSHIGGKRALIADISQKAMDLNFDGLMIETHHMPENAWTDAAQQVTPLRLKEIIENLVIRNMKMHNISQEILESLREEINGLDNQLIQTLKKRMTISKQIGEVKKDKGLTVLQNIIFTQLLAKNVNNATAEGMSKRFATELFKQIHLESINIQNEILKG
ncbi:MAG: chorismate mutase [Chitinophagales bacterium]